MTQDVGVFALGGAGVFGFASEVFLLDGFFDLGSDVSFFFAKAVEFGFDLLLDRGVESGLAGGVGSVDFVERCFVKRVEERAAEL